jgi:hypothetical protein
MTINTRVPFLHSWRENVMVVIMKKKMLWSHSWRRKRYGCVLEEENVMVAFMKQKMLSMVGFMTEKMLWSHSWRGESIGWFRYEKYYCGCGEEIYIVMIMKTIMSRLHLWKNKLLSWNWYLHTRNTPLRYYFGLNNLELFRVHEIILRTLKQVEDDFVFT